MNAKVLIGGVLGGVVLFALGWLIYGILMADSMTGMPCMRTPETMNYLLIGVGNILTGFMFAYIFSRWAGAMSFGAGAMAGAVIGLLLSAGFDCLMYATTTMMDSMTGVLMDVVISTVMYTIAGGVIGWWMGRK